MADRRSGDRAHPTWDWAIDVVGREIAGVPAPTAEYETGHQDGCARRRENRMTPDDGDHTGCDDPRLTSTAKGAVSDHASGAPADIDRRAGDVTERLGGVGNQMTRCVEPTSGGRGHRTEELRRKCGAHEVLGCLRGLTVY